MKKTMYIVLAIVGLMITDFMANYYQSKHNLEIRDQMIETEYKGASYYLNDIQNISAYEFSELLTKVSSDFQVSIFFLPNHIDIEKEFRESLFFYVKSEVTSAFLNSKTNNNSYDCSIYSTAEMDNTCSLLTVRDTDKTSFYPMSLFEEYGATTGGIINITAMSQESIGKASSYIMSQINSEIVVLRQYDDSAFRINKYKTVVDGLDSNYLIIGLSLLIMIYLLLFYNLKKHKKEIVIKKSLGFSGILIIAQFLKNYFLVPASVAFLLFPLYILLLSININMYLLNIFTGYALLFASFALLVLLSSSAIYYSVLVASNSELLKGRGRKNTISTSIFIFKLVIVPILLMTAFFSINSNDEFRYFADKKQYYENNLLNYKVLDVRGT